MSIGGSNVGGCHADVRCLSVASQIGGVPLSGITAPKMFATPPNVVHVDHQREADRIISARARRETLAPITDSQTVSMADAYAIQRCVTAARLAQGEPNPSRSKRFLTAEQKNGLWQRMLTGQISTVPRRRLPTKLPGGLRLCAFGNAPTASEFH